MFSDILDEKRKSLLPLLAPLREAFYLAGGTALALQLGHRDSIDFDFFTQEEFDPGELFEKLSKQLSPLQIVKIQEEEGTLSVIVDGEVKLSFFHYPYPLIRDPQREGELTLASLQDIAAMKLSAITGRATMKDYVDIYTLLHTFSLAELLSFMKEKFPSLDENLVLKSLIYFDDVEEWELLFREGKSIPFEEVKERIEREVHRYLRGE